MTAPTRGASGAWTALLLLSTGFLMSQAFRTIAAIMAAPLQAELQLSPQQLGVFAAAYHFAFGGLQLFMGMGIDLHGLRRTVLTASPLMALGAAVSALATGFPMLVAGQVLIGIGSAPAFLVCTIYVARHFAPERYTVVSSLILAVGGIGMVLTGSPLAWLIEATSWRMGFWVLAGCALLSWLAIALGVHEPAPAAGARRESLGQALEKALLDAAKGAGVALRVNRVGSMLTPFFTDREVTDFATARAASVKRYAAFFHGLLKRGVYAPPSQFEAWFVSLAHTPAHIEAAGRAAAEAMKEVGE